MGYDFLLRTCVFQYFIWGKNKINFYFLSQDFSEIIPKAIPEIQNTSWIISSYLLTKKILFIECFPCAHLKCLHMEGTQKRKKICWVNECTNL